MRRNVLCAWGAILAILIAPGLSGVQRVIADGAGNNATAANHTRKSLRVAVAQIPVSRDVVTNVRTIGRAMDRAIAQNAEVLLTPEGSLSGYTHQFDQSQVERGLRQLIDKARSSGLALALGTCFVESEDGRCYNQIRFYDGNGAFLGFHNKILRCGTMTTPPKGEIEHYAARPLRTFQLEGITIGGLICNDMWANPGCTPMPDPHLSQQLSQMRARIIFHAINGGRNGSDWSRNVFWPFHEANLRIRARTGKVWIVTADNCAPTNIPCSAPSGILKPDGHWAIQAPHQGEHVVVYTIQID